MTPRAVDLAWDVIARWGSDPTLASFLPREFFSDFVAVAEDEARHFTLLEERLKESGSYYGAIPVHDGCGLRVCSSSQMLSCSALSTATNLCSNCTLFVSPVKRKLQFSYLKTAAC